MDTEKNSKAGIFGGLAMIVILTLIGLYLYGANIANQSPNQLNNQNLPSIESTDPGDEIEDLEAGLEAFNPESLETGDAEVDSSLESEL